MSAERPEEFSNLPANRGARNPAGADDAKAQDTTVLVRGETLSGQEAASDAKNAPAKQATVVVRGETVQEQPKSPAKDSQSKSTSSKESQDKDSKPKEKEKAPAKEMSEAKVKMQSRLPSLDDDSAVGTEKEQVVTRDGKADLAFTGTLVASAAPTSATKGKWLEYRIYETNGGKHVFSKVGHSIYAEEQDTHEADVFDPSPSSMPSQLMRSARDLTRSHPMTWSDAAVAFFGYDPLAKTLYRKLSGQFEEHIS